MVHTGRLHLGARETVSDILFVASRGPMVDLESREARNEKCGAPCLTIHRDAFSDSLFTLKKSTEADMTRQADDQDITLHTHRLTRPKFIYAH